MGNTQTTPSKRLTKDQLLAENKELHESLTEARASADALRNEFRSVSEKLLSVSERLNWVEETNQRLLASQDVLTQRVDSYQKVIQFLSNLATGNVDYNQIVEMLHQLAITNPEVLCSAVQEKVTTQSDLNVQQKVVSLVKSGQMIPAIKLYRAHYRCGLKEAKDAVDRLVENSN